MMNFLNKLERKVGKFAIPNLSLWLIIGYAIGFSLNLLAPNLLSYLQLDPALILQGQVWRLFTWVLMPPSGSNVLFLVIMMMFYYQLGQNLEHTWGTFRFNVYMFGGMLFTIIGAFLLFGILYVMYGAAVAGMGSFFSTYYINMSIFLAFSVCYPDMEVMLYFILPIKMKWLAVVYGVLILVDLVQNPWPVRMTIVMSLLNFILFYFSTRNYKRVSPKEIRRRQAFKAQMREPQRGDGVTKHKCAVCGRTELDAPNLEFRFCSKCEGNYEYCQDHLFTHQHKKRM